MAPNHKLFIKVKIETNIYTHIQWYIMVKRKKGKGENKPQKVLIRISEETKKALDDMKVHPRETYDDVVQRLLERFRGEGRLLDGAVR